MPAFLSPTWSAPGTVRAFTTLRYGLGASKPPFDSFNMGERSGDDRDAVARNHAMLIEHAALPAAPRWLQQVHGTQVWRFEGAQAQCVNNDGLIDGAHHGEPTLAETPQGDAAVTSEAGTVLAILTADCLPVLFAARDGAEVAAAHAGWRGLAAGVIENTIATMRTPPRQLSVWLGPAAGPHRYEVGIDVYDAFVTHDRFAANAFVPTRQDHWLVDLYALARCRLERAGLSASHIHGGGLCTISDPHRFYSHRRDQRTGRMASLIWIQPDS